ncbi:MAG: hypothetical protein H0S79_18805 [Anaerolineaceae bacterium]|nr:hypothetical protein [Anaerolineaceae bacterium]
MKKTMLVGLCLLTLLSLVLSACGFTFTTGDSDSESIAQTMVALSATQTAIAMSQTEGGQETEEAVVPEETIEETEETEIIEETEEPVVEVTHNITPGEPGWIYKWFYDTDSSKNASSGYVTGGDDFVANLYERPFTESEMVYRPDIDIKKTEISSDDTFYYVIITLSGEHPDGELQAAYGVEIDEDRDGRGDLLVVADHPTSTTWSIDGVGVYRDSNNDVGGSSIMRPDSGYAGNGYDQVVFSKDMLDDPDAAWARISTSTPPTVTFAFKKSLVGMGTFVWGVWAADSLLDPALIDLHDNFTESEAGSPYQSHSTYPLKSLNLVDNTCRETYGFDATTPIMGLCYVPEEPTATPEPTAEPTSAPAPVTISGVAYDDNNNDGDRDPGEPTTIYSILVYLYPNAACSGSIRVTGAKTFSWSGLPAGTYCVKITGGGSMTTPSQYVFTLSPGQSRYVEFGFYVIQ